MGPLSFTEIFVIAVFALMVFGPDKLPGLLRSAGRFVADMRRMATELRSDFREGLDVEADVEPDVDPEPKPQPDDGPDVPSAGKADG